MTDTRYSGVDIFITVGGKTFTPDDLGLFQVDILDSDEGDNEVELHCSDNDYKIADSTLFRVGNTLSIKWGYTTLGQFSEERTGYVILKPATKYAKNGVVSTIKAKTKSATMAARRPQKTYGKTTLKTIVQEIVKRNTLKLELTGGDERLDGFVQGSWSDRQALRVLADRFGYQVSYSSETVTFAPRDFGATPKLLLIFGSGEDSNVLTADLHVDSQSNAGASVGASVASFDPKSKTGATDKADAPKQELAIHAGTGAAWTSKQDPDSKPASTPSAGTKSSSWVPSWAVPQSPTGGQSDAPPKDMMSMFSTPDVGGGVPGAHATSLTSRHQKKHAQLTIDAVGIPAAHARMIVEVRGLAKRDSGLYYVAKVHHKIKVKGAYECQFELNRHGVNAGGGAKVDAPVNQQKSATDNNGGTKKVAVSASSGKSWEQ